MAERWRGVQQMKEAHRYLQGRAGIDFAPVSSPVVLRLEGRYHEFLGAAPGMSSLFQVNRGLRFALPGP
jgi:hypothetical protein